MSHGLIKHRVAIRRSWCTLIRCVVPVLFAALLLGGCDSCGADESRAREREEDELLKGDPRAGDREAKPEPDEQALPNGGIELLPKTLPSRRAPPKKPAKGCKPGDPLCSDI